MASTALEQLVVANKWPAGFAKTILDSKESVAFRFVVVDNSRSMLKRDGHRLVSDRSGSAKFEECSRWEEVTSSMGVIVSHADAAGTPMEIRLLNKAQPVIVGQTANAGGANLEAVRAMLATEPSGLTPVCKQIREVIDRIRSMEAELTASNKIALLIIITDGESTDGNVSDMLKPLEGLPLQIIIRMCTDEMEVSEYWHNINASLDLDMRVLDDVEAEAVEVVSNNPWLTYGEPLHRAREFGVQLGAIDVLEERQLSKVEIKSVAEVLLAAPGSDQAPLPDPEADWETFVQSVATAQHDLPLVYCPVNKQQRSWINVLELRKYQPDPVRVVIERNGKPHPIHIHTHDTANPPTKSQQ